MNPIYDSFIKPMEDDGAADEQIVAAVAGRTLKNMPTADVRILMRERLLWLRDPRTAALTKGKIGGAIELGALPGELIDGLTELAAALWDSSANNLLTRDSPNVATQAKGLTDALLAMGVIAAEDVEAFYAVGGGLESPEFDQWALDAMRVDAAEELERREAVQSIQNAAAVLIGRGNAGVAAASAAFEAGDSAADIIAAGEAALAAE